MDKAEIEDWKADLREGRMLDAQTFLYGGEVVFIGYLWDSPWLGGREIGIVVNETFRERPKTLLKAAGEGVAWFQQTHGGEFYATAASNLRGRTRFLEKLGLKYEKTIPDYWGVGVPAEVYKCPSSSLPSLDPV